jgi:endo-1,4-beta-xylanase
VRVPELSDRAYAEALARHCRVLVSEGGLKWADLRPARDRFDFSQSDAFVRFGRAARASIRGHALVWYGAMPAWPEEIRTKAEAEAELVRHIETVMGRYKGAITSWDVVNEPTEDDPRRGAALRSFVFPRLLGETYIDLAFRTAAAVDPGAERVINEYDVEFALPASAAKRDAFLALLRRLRDRSVPLQAVGLQAHLNTSRPVDRAGFTAFLKGVRELGLEVLVTELDVVDRDAPGPIEARDRAVADTADRYLETLFETARPKQVLTWGLTDRFTWVPIYFKRPDGLPNRPLPLDEAYRPKPLLKVIERYCGPTLRV